MVTEKRVSPSPFANLLGLKVIRCDKEMAEVRLELRPDLLNALGIAHGGVTMTLLDVAMGRSARMADPQAQAGMQEGQDNEQKGWQGRGAVTSSMQVAFLRPGTGRVLTAYAQAVHVQGDEVEVQSWVMDERGKKVAQATGMFKYLRADR